MQLRSAAILASSAVLALAACDKQAAPTSSAAAPASSAPAAGSEAAPAAPAAATEGTPAQKFAAEINALGDELSAHSAKNTGGDPIGEMKGAVTIMRKLDNVKTDGLPEDLAAAFKAVQTAVSGMIDDLEKLPADMPKDQAAAQEYMTQHPEVMAVFAGLAAKGMAIETAHTTLKTTAEKHGLDITKFLEGGNPQ